MLFEKLNVGQISSLNWIAFFVSVAAYFIPEAYILKWILPNDSKVYNSKPYEEVKLSFVSVTLD